MSDLDAEDSLTKLNTQLNKSMVLMDTMPDNETYPPKTNRSIKINTKIQPASPANVSPVRRRSILKKGDTKNDERRDETEAQNTENERQILNNTNSRISINTPTASRPRNIDDLAEEESLLVESTDASFNLDNISDSDDIWIMDIPRTVDPKDLKGQTLIFGEKSKLKIKGERYYAVNHDTKCNVTCVFNTGKVKSQYKTVNVKPMGTISVRRKLSGISKIKPIQIEDTSVPFPENLKVRHPLFGVTYQGKVRKSAIK